MDHMSSQTTSAPALQPPPSCRQSSGANPPDPITSDLRSATPRRRLQGKIASLPKEMRDAINRLLIDGATYSTVAERMAEQGIDLNQENISNWYQTGFQNYLAELDRVEFQRARYEAATDLLKETDPSKLPQAGLQTAAAQIYDLLGHFAPTVLSQNIADDPDKYTRIVNALSRLARETLSLQKYQDACSRARATLQELRNPKRELSEEERHAIIMHVENILGLNTVGDIDWRDIPIMGGRNGANPKSTAKDNNQQQQATKTPAGNEDSEAVQNSQLSTLNSQLS